MRRYVVEYAFHKDKDGNVVRDVIDKTVRRLPKMYAFLDAAVAPGYLGGDNFTMADCFLAPIQASASEISSGSGKHGQQPELAKLFCDDVRARQL